MVDVSEKMKIMDNEENQKVISKGSNHKAADAPSISICAAQYALTKTNEEPDRDNDDNAVNQDDIIGNTTVPLQPGAYSRSLSQEGLQRRHAVRFSLVGVGTDGHYLNSQDVLEVNDDTTQPALQATRPVWPATTPALVAPTPGSPNTATTTTNQDESHPSQEPAGIIDQGRTACDDSSAVLPIAAEVVVDEVDIEAEIERRVEEEIVRRSGHIIDLDSSVSIASSRNNSNSELETLNSDSQAAAVATAEVQGMFGTNATWRSGGSMDVLRSPMGTTEDIRRITRVLQLTGAVNPRGSANNEDIKDLAKNIRAALTTGDSFVSHVGGDYKKSEEVGGSSPSKQPKWKLLFGCFTSHKKKKKHQRRSIERMRMN